MDSQRVSEIDKNKHKMSLSRMDSLAVSAVLEDCSVQLDILGHILEVQRRKVQEAADTQEIARLDELKMVCEDISQQMHKVHLELEEKQTFNCLLDAVREEEQKKLDQKLRREVKTNLEQRLKTLERKEKELQQKKQQLKELNRKHMVQSDQVKLCAFARARKKEKVKKEIQRLAYTHKETSPEEKLEKELEKQLKEEERVHAESMKFLQNQYEELQQKMQHWQQRTTQMQQENEQQLSHARCKRRETHDKLMEMRRKFQEMEQVVKEDREEQEKLRQHQEEARAATKLQACWRGCMVRRGLCAFKTADEGKKSKKGKKTKDGKKKKGKK